MLEWRIWNIQGILNKSTGKFEQENEVCYLKITRTPISTTYHALHTSLFSLKNLANMKFVTKQQTWRVRFVMLSSRYCGTYLSLVLIYRYTVNYLPIYTIGFPEQKNFKNMKFYRNYKIVVFLYASLKIWLFLIDRILKIKGLS